MNIKGKNNGMNDFDKIFVTIALWIAAISVFATALTLPMLPDKVTIFYKPVDVETEYFSKFNNLLITLASLVPIAALVIAASLRKRNKMPHNFSSIMLFCIMLSVCLGGVTVYGLMQQFSASGAVYRVDTNTLISLSCAFVLSVTASGLPMVFHSHTFKAGEGKRTMRNAYICASLERFWNIGSYGFFVTGIVCSFIPGALTYVPLTAFFVFELIFTLVNGHLTMKRSMEVMIYDQMNN